MQGRADNKLPPILTDTDFFHENHHHNLLIKEYWYDFVTPRKEKHPKALVNKGFRDLLVLFPLATTKPTLTDFVLA